MKKRIVCKLPVIGAAVLACTCGLGVSDARAEGLQELFSLPEIKEIGNADGLDLSLIVDQPVDYETAIRQGFLQESSITCLMDKVAPVVTTRDVECSSFASADVEPMDFIEQVEDDSEVTVEYAAEPDFTLEGEQTVRLLVTDRNGNATEAEAALTLLFDREPPVIEGVKELTVEIGKGVSYKSDVTVTDDSDEDVQLQVDNSAVNLDTTGDYKVTYWAEDSSGNRTEVSTTLHVISKLEDNVTEEGVNAAADEILAQITTSDMSQYETAKAIYDWTHDNIAYVDGSNKDNWIQAAYDGLVKHRGDCYVYAMSAKCLLTRAGITNMDIYKTYPAGTLHFWNLIDIGEGWYHFDTTRRKDGTTFFYWTDAELKAYSDTHDGSHAYDPALFPTIQ